MTRLAALTSPETAKALVDEGGSLRYDAFSYDVARHLGDRAAVDRAILAASAQVPQ
ncbi:hypothetical protein V1260_06330 [Brachybacterium sp. J144]|uniref:hypothetical protein n=1 Tax=Brachybacterium sp. J144 TaxID=3116487 RepID=UPI002E799BF2|nr:hypothetical protein [Brachybacterium sp. J144]MEE1650405.1 hypothetical protein [Brachybacterium sp. J144]